MTSNVIEIDPAAIEAHLKRPYTTLIVPEDDGTFRAEILEFPGCLATGDTAAEALASLDDVASSWLMTVLSRKQHVPEPIDNHDFSGKVVARFPKSLHKKATRIAEIEGVSLNQLIVTSLAQYVGERLAKVSSPPVSISSYQFVTFQSIGSSAGQNLNYPIKPVGTYSLTVVTTLSSNLLSDK